jgi:hypothetical protein
MVVPTGGVDKRRQPVSPGILHDHVQRLGMVSTRILGALKAKPAPHATPDKQPPGHMLILRQRLHQPDRSL